MKIIVDYLCKTKLYKSPSNFCINEILLINIKIKLESFFWVVSYVVPQKWIKNITVTLSIDLIT